MKRVLSQQIFYSPDKILTNTVIEIDEQKIITDLISLQDQIAEPSHTLFYDGIISSEIISITKNAEISENADIKDYQYVNINCDLSDVAINPLSKPLLIDFNSTEIAVINNFLKTHSHFFSNFNMLEIIAGCTYFPAIYLDISNEIRISEKKNLLVWKRILNGVESYVQVFAV